MPRSRRIRGLAGLLILTGSVPALAGDRDDVDFFEARVRPILVAKCLECHGDEKPKGGLSLASRAAILKGGDSGPAAEPGDPKSSLLIEAIRYETEPRMPPKGRLSEIEVDALTQWVGRGLAWPGSEADRPGSEASKPAKGASHWAFRPVEAVEPPAVSRPGWLRTPVDAFVLAKLEAEGLAPAPEADRRTLIRRLSIDLTGLPPTPEEVDAFLDDTRPDAYQQLVERLLASPHYGEQWARHWLDVARYSDAKGYVYAREERFWVHAWSYRDWVVRALNEDLPYDRFLALQLAAEQLAPDDPAQWSALGFLTLGRRFLGVTHDIIDDRIDVVTRGMLGLTVACARCHDHKYDPLSQRDYYSLYGVFRNSAERLVPAVAGEPREEGEYLEGLRGRRAKQDEAMARERAAAAGRVRARVGDYLRAQFELAKYPEEGFDQLLSADDLIPESVRRWRLAIVRAGERGDPVFRAWHAFTGLDAEEFTTRASVVVAELASAPPDTVNPLVARAFTTPPASLREVADRYGTLFAEVRDRWEAALKRAQTEGRPGPEALPEPEAEAVRRWLYGPDSPCEVPDESIVNTEAFFPTSVTEALWKLQGDVDRWLIARPESPPHALILVDRAVTTDARVFRRGNPANLGDEAPRRFLEVLAGPDAPRFSQGSGRRELAEAIVDPSNPLTARVAVNRVWMHHFGAGLVGTPGDFGTRAEPPSHPELLDWLAARTADGWSLKALHRLIVNSATYRQSVAGPEDPDVRDLARRVDPENRLLWCRAPHRLTFEELRDALLAATGELDRAVGGKAQPLFRTPYPARRTLYGTIERDDLPGVYRTFDFANPDLLIPQRNETTVPQQALFLLNHPFPLDRVRALAKHPEVVGAEGDAAKIQALYRRVFRREPTADEVAAALEVVRGAEGDPAPALSPTASAWQYGFGRYDESARAVADFQPLPYFNGSAWQGGPSWPDAAMGWIQLTAEGGHAGNDLAHAAIRRWVAPKAATVRIVSELHHDVAGGDGIRGFLHSSRHGTLQRSVVHNGHATFHIAALKVEAGDAIDFVVDFRDGLNSDQFRWAAAIHEVGGESPLTWDARADFGGLPTSRLGPWEQLAQVLLISNEFSFVD